MADDAAAVIAGGFTTISVLRPSPGVYELRLDRPSARNAMTLPFFSELPRALDALSALPDARAVVLSAAGAHFCAGIDVSALGDVAGDGRGFSDQGAAADALRRRILELQSAVSALERCRKPVIAAIHGACIGGGIDLVLAADIRWCSSDAIFSVKEVDMALVADLGTLQRLPKVVGYGNAVDLALTGRVVSAAEAKDMGLVTKVLSSREALTESVLKLASEIARKSSLAVIGTKAVLLRSRDVTVEQGLEHVATWNSAMLRSRDLEEAVKAYLEKRKPTLSKL